MLYLQLIDALHSVLDFLSSSYIPFFYLLYIAFTFSLSSL